MPMVNVPAPCNKYAAKMLFQFRFQNEPENSYRTVEERIVLNEAPTAELAYTSFLAKGRSQERQFHNDEGQLCQFEFIGIIDMIHLGLECDDDEVWYSIRKMRRPMERRDAIVPERKSLSAFVYEKKSSPD